MIEWSSFWLGCGVDGDCLDGILDFDSGVAMKGSNHCKNTYGLKAFSAFPFFARDVPVVSDLRTSFLFLIYLFFKLSKKSLHLSDVSTAHSLVTSSHAFCMTLLSLRYLLLLSYIAGYSLTSSANFSFSIYRRLCYDVSENRTLGFHVFLQANVNRTWIERQSNVNIRWFLIPKVPTGRLDVKAG